MVGTATVKERPSYVLILNLDTPSRLRVESQCAARLVRPYEFRNVTWSSVIKSFECNQSDRKTRRLLAYGVTTIASKVFNDWFIIF